MGCVRYLWLVPGVGPQLLLDGFVVDDMDVIRLQAKGTRTHLDRFQDFF